MGFKFSKQESLSCHELYEGTGLIQLHRGNEIRLLLNKRSGMCREGMVFIFFPKKSKWFVYRNNNTYSLTNTIRHTLVHRLCHCPRIAWESLRDSDATFWKQINRGNKNGIYIIYIIYSSEVFMLRALAVLGALWPVVWRNQTAASTTLLCLQYARLCWPHWSIPAVKPSQQQRCEIMIYIYPWNDGFLPTCTCSARVRQSMAINGPFHHACWIRRGSKLRRISNRQEPVSWTATCPSLALS